MCSKCGTSFAEERSTSGSRRYAHERTEAQTTPEASMRNWERRLLYVTLPVSTIAALFLVGFYVGVSMAPECPSLDEVSDP
jgi:hypothetical protein